MQQQCVVLTALEKTAKRQLGALEERCTQFVLVMAKCFCFVQLSLPADWSQVGVDMDLTTLKWITKGASKFRSHNFGLTQIRLLFILLIFCWEDYKAIRSHACVSYSQFSLKSQVMY
jgi:hypothetical protein